MDTNMQLTINSFRQLSLKRFFPDISLTFSKIPDISPTAVKFPTFPGFPDEWSPCYYESYSKNKRVTFSQTHYTKHNRIA